MLAVNHEHSPTECISDWRRPHGPLDGEVHQQINESRPALREMRVLLVYLAAIKVLSWESAGGMYRLEHDFFWQQYLYPYNAEGMLALAKDGDDHMLSVPACVATHPWLMFA